MTWRLHRAQPPLRHEEREAVLQVVGRIDDPAAKLHAAVIMDDHVHALVSTGPTSRPEDCCTRGRASVRIG